jgi:hypothetical protein
MKKIIILAAVSALMMGGCSSITTEPKTTEPKNDEVIPYEQDNSLAWNVMNQIESADKLYDVNTMKGDSVKDTSALGHIGFALLSGNFFGGLTASVATDTKKNITHANIIQSLDLSNAPNGDLKLEVANQFIAKLKSTDPSVVIESFEEYQGGYSFIEKSTACTRGLKDKLSLYPDSSYAQKNMARNSCLITLELDVIGPSNLKVFKDSQGETTVRLYTTGNRHPNSLIETFKDSYLFHAAFQYPGSDRVSIPFVEYKNQAYLFMKKTSDGKEQVIPFSEMPNQKYLKIGR